MFRRMRLTVVPLVLGAASAAGTGFHGRPPSAPRSVTVEAPRLELRVRGDNLIRESRAGDVSYPMIGARVSVAPWMPEGRRESRGYVVSFEVTLTAELLARRSTADLPLLLVTGRSAEDVATELDRLAAPVRETALGGPRPPARAPAAGGVPVRSVPMAGGKARVITEVDFELGLLYDPDTSMPLCELRRVR